MRNNFNYITRARARLRHDKDTARHTVFVPSFYLNRFLSQHLFGRHYRRLRFFFFLLEKNYLLQIIQGLIERVTINKKRTYLPPVSQLVTVVESYESY